MLVLVSCFFDKSLCFSSKALPGVQISKATFRLWIHQFFDENQWFLMIFWCFSRASWSIAKPACWFFHPQFSTKKHRFSGVFRVLFIPLQKRRVDFLTVNIDEKSCYFRVFFACFLTDCKTGVLIFSCYAERRVLVHHELPKNQFNKLRITQHALTSTTNYLKIYETCSNVC